MNGQTPTLDRNAPLPGFYHCWMANPSGNVPPNYGYPQYSQYNSAPNPAAPGNNGFPQQPPVGQFPYSAPANPQFVQPLPVKPSPNVVQPQFSGPPQPYAQPQQQQMPNGFTARPFNPTPTTPVTSGPPGAPIPNMMPPRANPTSSGSAFGPPTSSQPIGFSQPPSFGAPQAFAPSYAPPTAPLPAPTSSLSSMHSGPPMPNVFPQQSSNGFSPAPPLQQPVPQFAGGLPARPAAVPPPPQASSVPTPGGFPQPGPPQPFPAPVRPQQQVQPQYGAPAPHQQNYGVTQQQPQHNVQQMNNQYGQMNMGGAPAQPYRSDVIDLLAERNVHQFGCDDVEVTLPLNMANPEARVSPNVFRCTVGMVPQSEELLKKSRLPLAVTLHPFRDIKNLNVIQTGNIVRCRYCRTYINPFVYLPDNRHWKCNMCNRNNDLPDDFSWDPSTKSFGDPRMRPEIQNSTVEFVAPAEYMLRDPQPAVYVFVLDVSAAAIHSGYLRTFAEQLLICLDQMPGDDRAVISFIAVDACLHFFTFNDHARCFSEMIIDDVNEAFLPTVGGIPTSNGNCLGAALTIAQQMITQIGGRISVFQASLPNLGPGALQPRDEPKITENVQNFGPATDFYKNLSLEGTGVQICMDLFMFNSEYADIASISEISKFSTGCIYTFPNFRFAENAVQVKRFESTFARYLTRRIGFEAVLRIRCTRGVSLSGFHGNFFVRAPDLLAFANCNPDSALAAQVTLEEKLAATVCFQSALLYTSSKGDRRIRVHTMCLPTTGDLMQLYNHFDVKATVSYLAKIGSERSMLGTALTDSREAIVNAVVDSLGAYQKALSRGGGLLVPRCGQLRLFPTYALAMLKYVAFSATRHTKLDERVSAMLMIRFSPLEQIISDIYPRLFRLNDLLQPLQKTVADDGSEEEVQPQVLPLTFEHIHRDGVYLMEAGSTFFVYVGANSDPSFVHNLFGCAYEHINEQFLRELDNEISRRVHSFIKNVQTQRFFLGPLIIIKEHSPLREQFIRRLVDDRSESTHSYVEFLQHIKREISS
ncbi:unnamed protein product [Caenorhabditis auriculariae]|uniref:Uncharacterized protein n=1 Tax=Caenorhabditis auriculariae TaxID=2777116 RepID=A0A8S1HSP3_9PELO|nr:unnamed protein product [Caenorhabditis auriculariae]